VPEIPCTPLIALHSNLIISQPCPSKALASLMRNDLVQVVGEMQHADLAALQTPMLEI
jgi:hypothetical protein